MSDLRSAPVPPLRDDDHVRGGDDGGPLVVFYGDFACPRCAVEARRLRERARARRLPPLRPEGQARARGARSRRRPRPPPARAPSGPSTTRSTPTRAGSTTRTCGRAARPSASTSTASRPTAATRRSPSACAATCATPCGRERRRRRPCSTWPVTADPQALAPRGRSTVSDARLTGSDSVRDTTKGGDRRPARKGSTYEH